MQLKISDYIFQLLSYNNSSQSLVILIKANFNQNK